MESSGRLFLCAKCRKQVLICRGCDHGQCYCPECAPTVRRGAVREAGKRYQNTRRGRHTHAERSRRYRARQNKVTHQGSPRLTPDDVLVTNSTTRLAVSPNPLSSPVSSPRCHFCAGRCSDFVRTGHLRRRVSRPVMPFDRRGIHRDHSP